MTKNAQVAHIWAQRNKRSMQGSNFWFEGDTLYSYNTPIARHYDGYTIVSDYHYSSSTQRHQSYARQAVNGTLIVVPVELSEVRNHSSVLELMQKQVIDHLNAQKRARSSDVEYHRACVVNGMLASYAYLHAKLPDNQKSRYNVALELWDEANEAAARARSYKQKPRDNKTETQIVHDWRDCRRSSVSREVYGYFTDVGNCILRWNAKHNRLETSLGVHVSRGAVDQFVSTYNKYDWPTSFEHDCNSWSAVAQHAVDTLVGDFRLKSIDEQGNVVIGCHTIAAGELQYIASILGIELKRVTKQENAA